MSLVQKHRLKYYLLFICLTLAFGAAQGNNEFVFMFDGSQFDESELEEINSLLMSDDSFLTVSSEINSSDEAEQVFGQLSLFDIFGSIPTDVSKLVKFFSGECKNQVFGIFQSQSSEVTSQEIAENMGNLVSGDVLFSDKRYAIGTQGNGTAEAVSIDDFLSYISVDVSDDTRGSGVIIAVIDSGVTQIDGSPPIMAESLDLIDVDIEIEDKDSSGHGTIITRIANSVAPSADMLSITACVEGICFVDRVIFGMCHAATLASLNERKLVINLSMSDELNQQNGVLADALTKRLATGITIVTSVGNFGNPCVSESDFDSCFPAKFNILGEADGLITTASLARINGNFVPADVRVNGDYIDVAALGENLVVDGFIFSGSSFAAPWVSGVAALILATDPNLTNTKAEECIKRFAVSIGDSQFVGLGRIDVSNLISENGTNCQ